MSAQPFALPTSRKLNAYFLITWLVALAQLFSQQGASDYATPAVAGWTLAATLSYAFMYLLPSVAIGHGLRRLLGTRKSIRRGPAILGATMIALTGLTHGRGDAAVLVLVLDARVGVVPRVTRLVIPDGGVFLRRDGVTVRVLGVHELPVLRADLVMNERVVQCRQHLDERELCQNEGPKDAQPRRKSRFSCGAERLEDLLGAQTRRYSSTARCDLQEPCRRPRACRGARGSRLRRA